MNLSVNNLFVNVQPEAMAVKLNLSLTWTADGQVSYRSGVDAFIEFVP